MVKHLEKEIMNCLAAGRVLKRDRDTPRFSPKAAAMMFEEILEHIDYAGSLSVYDPFCGNGTMLAVLQTGYGEWIDQLFGSDINPRSVYTTKHNLDILNAPGGIERRIDYFEQMHRTDQRQASEDRLSEALALRDYLYERESEPTFEIFEANALLYDDPGFEVDLIITDPPYSNESMWIDDKGHDVKTNLLHSFLRNARNNLKAGGKMGLIFQSGTDLDFPGYRVEKVIDLRKRTGYILSPL